MDIKEKAGEIKEKIEDAVKSGKIKEALDKTDLDDKVIEKAKELKDKIKK